MRDWPESPEPRYPVAVFVDRDGTINVDTHYPHEIEDLHLYPGALEGLRRLARLPVHVIVVSNQAGIAHGQFTRVDMSRFNEELRRSVEASGGRIDAFYFCPHKEPHELAPGEEACPCSKPKPGMLLEAARDFGIDPGRSVMIGDKRSDILAGRRAGSSTILVHTGKAGLEPGGVNVAPDSVADDLAAAARLVEAHLFAPAAASG